MPRSILALLLTCLATAAAAQSIGEPLPGRAAPRESFSKPAPTAGRGARPCPEYGAGFVRLEGSSFCVRAGGAVRAEFGKSSRSGYGSRADGMVYLESRGESAFGPVRSVLSVRGGVDRGLDSGPFRY
ncbi:porin [Bosea sp. NBC_00550]|uniref:porin n=1 Tax=Bosea sp. NBC_00550 TaxID=2969621 RepID=UPI002231BD92|nr:porin [Bosea sp. NBC_00550]UZF92885.1 porin [Bosea sp. NBC_00550]